MDTKTNRNNQNAVWSLACFSLCFECFDKKTQRRLFTSPKINLGCTSSKKIEVNWKSNKHWNPCLRHCHIDRSAHFVGCMRALTTLGIVTWCFCFTSIIKILISLRYSKWLEEARACKLLKFDWLISIQLKIYFILSNLWTDTKLNTASEKITYSALRTCSVTISSMTS